ncbi:MAG: metallophosphoesterase [Methanomicrobiales archaeon]|nr:metallophosphoesterase [Methanomicrobiales archaeon]
MVKTAVSELNRRRASLVLHAGDFVAPFVVREMWHLQAPFVGVFGNNDGDRELLRKLAAEKTGCEIRGNFAALSLDGLRLAICHGEEPDLLEALVQGQLFDLVVHGHSHRKEIAPRGKTLSVNPGEVCGYLTGISTIGIYDTRTRNAELIELPVTGVAD